MSARETKQESVCCPGCGAVTSVSGTLAEATYKLKRKGWEWARNPENPNTSLLFCPGCAYPKTSGEPTP